MPAALFDAIKGRGLFRLVLPTAFGGEQANLGTLVEVVEEISRRDGSVGWNLMIGSLGGCFADYLPEDVAQEILLNDQVAVGVFAPTGQAVRVEGGYRASGRWAFGSGCQNADWLTGGFLLMEDGKPRMNPDGSPDRRSCSSPVRNARSSTHGTPQACEVREVTIIRWRTSSSRRAEDSHSLRSSGDQMRDPAAVTPNPFSLIWLILS